MRLCRRAPHKRAHAGLRTWASRSRGGSAPPASLQGRSRCLPPPSLCVHLITPVVISPPPAEAGPLPGRRRRAWACLVMPEISAAFTQHTPIHSPPPAAAGPLPARRRRAWACHVMLKCRITSFHATHANTLTTACSSRSTPRKASPRSFCNLAAALSTFCRSRPGARKGETEDCVSLHAMQLRHYVGFSAPPEAWRPRSAPFAGRGLEHTTLGREGHCMGPDEHCR